jgi:hypothetical protein
MTNKIIEVDAECHIYYSDGSMKLCKYVRPGSIYQDCGPGYGDHGDCPKYEYYHKKNGGM